MPDETYEDAVLRGFEIISERLDNHGEALSALMSQVAIFAKRVCDLEEKLVGKVVSRGYFTKEPPTGKD